MAHSQPSQVTGQTGAQPTKDKIELCEQKGMENGHCVVATLARDNLESRE